MATACLRYIALVSVKDSERNAERPGEGTDPVDVRVIARDSKDPVSIRLGKRILLLAAVTPNTRRAQIRAILKGFHLQFFETDHHRLVFEIAGGHRNRRHRFVT